MRNLLIATIFAVAWANVGPTQAQVYPSRPITIVVPLPAGSAFDVTARLLAERMQVFAWSTCHCRERDRRLWKRRRRPRRPRTADGYTLCFGGVGHTRPHGAVLALPFDVLKDFEPSR